MHYSLLVILIFNILEYLFFAKYDYYKFSFGKLVMIDLNFKCYFVRLLKMTRLNEEFYS